MNLDGSIELYAGGPGSGCRGTNCGRKPGLVYHWTDKESLQSIMDTGQWDGGSATRNPAYRFSKGVPGETRFALIFDSSKGGFKDRTDQTVPWKEWEVLHDKPVDLFDFPNGKFVGFGVRDARSRQSIHSMQKKVWDEPNMFPVFRVGRSGIVGKGKSK